MSKEYGLCKDCVKYPCYGSLSAIKFYTGKKVKGCVNFSSFIHSVITINMKHKITKALKNFCGTGGRGRLNSNQIAKITT